MSRDSVDFACWPPFSPPSGHVFRVERARGPVWYAKYRLPDGRQVQKKIGPAWTERGRPPAGYFTKRTGRGLAARRAGRGAARNAARDGPDGRDVRRRGGRVAALHRARPRRKPSTVAGYRAIVRAHLLPAFGELPLESITTAMIERWLAGGRRIAEHAATSRWCCCTGSSSARRRCGGCRRTRSPTSRSRR